MLDVLSAYDVYTLSVYYIHSYVRNREYVFLDAFYLRTRPSSKST